MEVSLRNQWVQLAIVGIVAVLLGLVVSAVLFSAGPSGPTLGPVKLTTGGSVHSSFPNNPRASRQIVEEELPLTAAEAVAVGWKDPLLCDQGRGKYFQKVAGEGTPYTLLYDSEDELIGIYLISDTEKPAPWELTEEIKGGAGPIIDYEHWGLFIYFRDPTRACATTQFS